MKILAITASPRRNGNSETLLDMAISGAKKNGKDVKKLIVPELRISPCNGCGACLKTGECVIKDDMQIVYAELLSADVLLVASPIHFKGLPCMLKCVIDRCQALWARKYVLKKGRKNKKRHGAAILVCARSKAPDMFTGALLTLEAWFKTLDIDYKKELLAPGLEEEVAALKNKKLLKRAVEFGKKLTM